MSLIPLRRNTRLCSFLPTRNVVTSSTRPYPAAGAHRRIRELYRGFPQSVVTSAVAVEKVIGGKRGCLKHLLIHNYEPPKTPLYTRIAGEPKFMDLFGLEAPYEIE